MLVNDSDLQVSQYLAQKAQDARADKVVSDIVIHSRDDADFFHRFNSMRRLRRRPAADQRVFGRPTTSER